MTRTRPSQRSDIDWEDEILQKVQEMQESASEPTIAAAADITVNDPILLAGMIDHTLLKPEATVAQIDRLCDEAVRFKFKSCCVNGANIARVSERLKSAGASAATTTIPCVVVGFPLGACTSEVKAFETKQAIENGAREIDMVINIGFLKSKSYSAVYQDIHQVVQATTSASTNDNTSTIPVKVIIETALLSDEKEKIAASYIAAEAGASFVKTCTGFSLTGGGATKEDVSLMKRVVAYKQGEVLVKASAGIRSLEKCKEVLAAGADRIGTSSGCAIMEEIATVVTTRI